MRVATFSVGIIIGAIVFSGASVILAWTGPTASPPNNNVAAPINVGTIDQIKNAGIGMNSLAVFGNAIISTVSGYLNFGPTVGSAGYGFRDNAGTMEFKNSGGIWRDLGSSIQAYLSMGAVTLIKFSDGTTQTTAASSTGGGSGTSFWAASGNNIYNTNTANVGIGTTNPAAKLEVSGQVKITGGSPGAGKVLTSDAAGLASWQTNSGGGGSSPCSHHTGVYDKRYMDKACRRHQGESDGDRWRWWRRKWC